MGGKEQRSHSRLFKDATIMLPAAEPTSLQPLLQHGSCEGGVSFCLYICGKAQSKSMNLFYSLKNGGEKQKV